MIYSIPESMKRLFYTLILLAALAVLPNKAYADCQAVYGGWQTCTTYNFTIEKLVQIPNGSNFVDNLSINDPKYSPSQTINYELV